MKFPAYPSAFSNQPRVHLNSGICCSNNRGHFSVLDFLYSHSIAKDFQFDPLLLDASFLPLKKMQLMDQFWKSAKQSDNLVRDIVDQKKRALEKWGFLSYCVNKTDGGVNLIQFAALIDDEEPLKHLAETGSKTLSTAVSCRSEELGKIVVSNGQVKQLPPIVTYASILFNDLGDGQIITRSGDKP